MRMLTMTTLTLMLIATVACSVKNSKDSVQETTPAAKITPAGKVEAKPVPASKTTPAAKITPAPKAKAESGEAKKKKKRRMPLGLLHVTLLKEEFGLEKKQLRECQAVYADNKDRIAAAAEKIKNAPNEQKKAVRKEIAPLRKEIIEKIIAVFTPEQKTKYEEFMAKRREAAKKRQQEKQPK